MSIEYPGHQGAIINPECPPGSQPIERPEAIIKATSISYLIWDVKDFDKQAYFLNDFGMLTHSKTSQELYMKGYDGAPYIYYGRKAKKTAFIGIGFSVNSFDNLKTLSTKTNQPIETLSRPGGGSVVRLTDPNGVVIEVCFGIEQGEKIDTRREPLKANTRYDSLRVNKGVRPPLMAAPILDIGHCVLGADDFTATTHWYMQHLGLIPTDVLCLEDGSPSLTFMRLDLGDTPADHHTVVVAKGAGEKYLHSAYEVIDMDAVAQGQQFLKMKKQYKHFWGIGRHILGSQVFDYWYDPFGFEFEHYADGDVYTADHPTDYHLLDSGNIYAWGHDLPKSMYAPKPKQVINFIKGLFKGTYTISWIKMAKAAISRPARPWL